jgi:hypothetical protein
MPLVNNLWLQDVGAALEVKNPNGKHQYLYSQVYVNTATGSPFESLIPKVSTFYGPRVLTLQVISRAYVWNDAYVATELERFKQMFGNWDEFKAYFWIDYTIASQVDAINSNTQYTTKMNTVKGKVIAACAEMADFGWVYKGDITSGVEASFFQPFIDEFWKS